MSHNLEQKGAKHSKQADRFKIRMQFKDASVKL